MLVHYCTPLLEEFRFDFKSSLSTQSVCHKLRPGVRVRVSFFAPNWSHQSLGFLGPESESGFRSPKCFNLELESESLKEISSDDIICLAILQNFSSVIFIYFKFLTINFTLDHKQSFLCLIFLMIFPDFLLPSSSVKTKKNILLTDKVSQTLLHKLFHVYSN